ncbi:GTPase Obg, partial [Dissostichus eleginoides]
MVVQGVVTPGRTRRLMLKLPVGTLRRNSGERIVSSQSRPTDEGCIASGRRGGEEGERKSQQGPLAVWDGDRGTSKTRRFALGVVCCGLSPQQPSDACVCMQGTCLHRCIFYTHTGVRQGHSI